MVMKKNLGSVRPLIRIALPSAVAAAAAAGLMMSGGGIQSRSSARGSRSSKQTAVSAVATPAAATPPSHDPLYIFSDVATKAITQHPDKQDAKQIASPAAWPHIDSLRSYAAGRSSGALLGRLGLLGHPGLAGFACNGTTCVGGPNAGHSCSSSGTSGSACNPAANTAPSLGGTFTTAGTVNDNTTTTPFSGVSYTDPDGTAYKVFITYTAANGTLAGTGVTGSAGSYTVTGSSVSDVQSKLRAVVFTPTANQVAVGSTVVTTFTLKPNDGTVDGTSNATTQVTATSINNAPTFVSAGAGSLTVAESASATDLKALLHVNDADISQTETWTQSVAPSHGSLTISSATASSGSTDITPGGTLTYTPTAGYVGSDTFTIQVSDGTATATRVINVTVTAPTVTVNALTLNAMTVGTAFSTQSFSGAGGYGAYTYSVSAGALPTGLALNTSTGALTGTPTSAGAYSFTIQATDSSTGSGPYSGTRAFSGTVAAAPNVAPTFVSAGAGSLTVAQSASATDLKSLLHVSDSDSSQTETWSQSVAPSHGSLTITSATASSGSTDITPGGTLTYTPTAGYVGSDTFTIQVSDGSASATRQINVTVSAPTVTVNALTLNAMAVGTAFTSQSFSGAGGYGAYTYSVSAGALPAGLSLNTSTGALTGTPTSAGAYSFTIQATDSSTGTGAPFSGTRAFSGTVAAANVAPTFVGAGAGSLTVAQAASATDITGLLSVSDTDSSQTETWSQSTAPSHGSLSFSGATAASGSTSIAPGGTITYTPTASYVGSDSFAVQVSDSFGSATRTVNVTVGSARTVTVDALTLNSMSVGTAFTSQSFTGAGGYGAYTYSVSVGALPAGLSLNSSTGALTGTPTTAGAYSFTIQATDSSTGSGPYTGTRAFSGTVAAAPAVNSVAVPANGKYKAGRNLDFTVTWDGNVTVTGTPSIALDIGGTAVQANYVSSPTATTSLFRYTVLAGQTDTDGITVGALNLNGGTIQSGGGANATLTLNSVASTTNVLVDTTAPTLPAANIVVNNQADPHKVVLTFSEALDSANIGSAANWTVTGNGGSPTYNVASVALASGNQITLTLAAVDLSGSTSAISNAAANAHLKVTPPATLTDVAGNTYAAGLVTEAGATHVLDSTAPTLSSVASSSPSSSGGSLTATASEKAKGYWIAVASGAAAPTVAQVKAGASYGAVTVVASGNGVLPAASAGSISLTGLAASTAYDLYLVAEDAAGNLSVAASTATLTTTAAPVDSSPPPSTTITLPTGGGTATATAGQTLVVTDNGKSGTVINLPTPPAGTGNNSVNVTLPGNGTVVVNSNSSGTQIAVQQFTPPGGSAPISTVQVSAGSATLTASGAGQTLVTTGLSNGLTVTSGGSGTVATVTASGNSQSLVLTGNANLTLGSSLDTQRSTVTLNQGSNGSASQANLNIGGQTLSVSTSGGNTQLQVVPTGTVSGQSTSGIVITGGSANIVGQSGQVMNVVPVSSSCGGFSGGYFEARSNNAQSSILSVNQGNLALTGHIPQGVVAYHYTSSSCNSFTMATPLAGGVAKDVLIYQGEYVEVDKNGQPVRIVVRSQDGSSGAAGDPLTPTAIANLRVDTVIPRLDLSTGRLPTGQTIVQSIANMLKLGSSGWVFSSQDGQGAIRVSNSGSGAKVALLPVGQVLADAERQDGVQCGGNGLCQTAAGNLVTSFNAALDAPQDFIAALRRIDSSASLRLNSDGNLQVTVYGRTYLAQAGWNVLPSSGGNGFASGDSGLTFSANGSQQALYPVLADLKRLQTVLQKIDPSASAQGDHQGAVTALVNGQSYRLLPDWELIATPASHAGDDYWLDNGVLYLNFLDGTAQGIRTK
jgi:hypothetical protein